MLMIKERRPAIPTLRGWAISVLQEAGAIRECEEHGWMQDRADPHARERAFDIARRGCQKECVSRVSVSLPYEGDTHGCEYDDKS
jgi:hypothetical protein